MISGLVDSIGFYVVWAIMVVHEQYFSLYIIFTSNQTKSKIISLFFNLFFSFSLFTLFCWVFFVFYYNIKGETGNVATFRLLRLNAKIKKNKQTNKQKYLWKTWKKRPNIPPLKKILFQWDSNSWSLELKASALSTRPICSWTKEGLFSIRSWWNITVVISPWNCLPLKRFVYVLLICTQYANFKLMKMIKCLTRAYIYSS